LRAKRRLAEREAPRPAVVLGEVGQVRIDRGPQARRVGGTAGASRHERESEPDERRGRETHRRAVLPRSRSGPVGWLGAPRSHITPPARDSAGRGNVGVALIEFRNVKKAFGPKVVYADLNLDIQAGEAL